MINYFSLNLWMMWALIAVICLIFELLSGGFFIICFSFGALASVVAALLGVSFVGQVIVFAVFSFLCLFLVRPFALRYLHNRHEPDRVSNADAILGRIGFVSQDIEQGGYGRVAIDGDDWKALSSDGSAISKGAKVKVLSRDSIIITVSAVPDDAIPQ
jgi:membrane protein implicated in regulation of membrane protease activity